MSKKNKKSSQKLSNFLREAMLKLFKANEQKAYNYKQVAQELNVQDKEIRKLIFELLTEMKKDGFLNERERGLFSYAAGENFYTGTIEFTNRGSAFVTCDDFREDIFIPTKNVGKALNGDKVRVRITAKARNRKPEGVVMEILERNDRLFVGTMDIQQTIAFLVPDDPKIDVDIFIPVGKLNEARHGDKAVARLTDWPDTAKNPFGEVIEVYGRPGSNDAEMKAILVANGIKFSFPDDVLAEANNISASIQPDEIAKRRDFRNITTFTIDPVDAKDFDDAISVEFLENGNIAVGVHIADVAHYVTENSALDQEALLRGNSVYLADRVVPMLPEHLSNGICSLRPHEEKLTFSAVFELNDQAKVLNEWFGKTIICSAHRFTYEQAQEIIETKKGDYAKEILVVDNLAKKLRAERMKNGALEVQSTEIRFEFDKDGKPIGVVKKIIKDSNKLIEEFMLLANRQVGAYVGDSKRKTRIPLIYRVHDKPDPEKVEQFRVFLSKFGKNFSYRDERDIARKMNEIFHQMKDEPSINMIQQMAIKSMAKAEYDTQNIGHYGLAFTHYAHFTSPIRRYADLVVHRILFEAINYKTVHHAKLTQTARHISITERKATDAERMSRKFFQAQFLKDRVGDEFEGTITGLSDWGMFVELTENFCEGMIALKSMKDDRYYFDERDYVVVGVNDNKEFNVGDKVKVKLNSVSLARKQIDFVLVND
ncbi:MAG: ribonuclease R [Crocinitomicaceae bacterium]|nr:ribonuclease R [Crocinitomicaceae bacterium]MBK8927887.1 ribonuclease R [Crocinitomicaceae bacterium]